MATRRGKSGVGGEEALKERLEALALKFAEALMADAAPSKGAVETFKVISNFYVGSRSKGLGSEGEEGEDDGAFSFKAAKRKFSKKESE